MKAKITHFLFRPLSYFGISHKFQTTALWSMLESFSSPLFSLLLIPIFTNYMGLENYGLYVMFMAFVSFFGFTGLGMSTSITYYLAVNYQTSNPKHIAELLGSAMFLTLFGTVVFSCLLVLCFYLFYSPLKLSYPQLIGQQHLIFAAVILIVITQLDTVVSASLKGLQQFKMSSKVEFVLRLLSFLIVSVIAVTQKNVGAVILITLIMSLFNLIIRYYTLNKTVRFHFTDIKPNKKRANELFYFGKWMTLQNISGAIFNSLDKLILGFYFNTTLVGIYNIIISITQLTHFVTASAASFLLPKITASSANIKILKLYYYKSLMASLFLASLMMFTVAAIYPYLSKHFNFLEFKYEYFVMLISYGVLAVCVPPYNFALGLGKVKVLSNINTVSALIGIITLYLLVERHEILGAVLARVAYTSIVVITFIVPWHIFKKKSL